MGVHGLWRLVEPSGKPVPLETLENKILAVDISIWLHQAVKGFQDARGAPLPNAHLLGIYHRVCKLLYFRVKPVFVFDGGVPALKKQTIAKRNQQKTKILNDASTIQQKLLSSLLKHSAVAKVISEKTNIESPPKNDKDVSDNDKQTSKDDMFKLPELPSGSELDSTLDTGSSSETDDSSPTKQWDLHTIDEKSVHFKSLPADVRHDILTDLKEQRKQSSWGRLHELPTESGDFSQFQMKRLLKRYSVQVSLEEATKEMGGHSLSLGELEALLTEEGIVTASKGNGSRIASDENKRYLLIKDVRKAMEKAKKDDEEENAFKSDSKEVDNFNEDKLTALLTNDSDKTSTISEHNEYERDLQAAIQLSLMDTPSTSKDVKNIDYIENFNDGDFESESDSEFHKTSKSILAQAKSYMIEYSGLTPSEIAKIIEENAQKVKKNNKHKLDVIFDNDPTKSCGKEKYIQNEADTSKTINLFLDKNVIEKKIEEMEMVKCFSDSDESESNQIDNNFGSAVNKILTDLNETQENENVKSCTLNNTVEIMSDSDDSDLVEVGENLSDRVKSEAALEVVIKPVSELKDDLFSDIFSVSPKEITIPENKIKEKKHHELIVEKNVDIQTIQSSETENNVIVTSDAQEEKNSEIIFYPIPENVPKQSSLTMEQLNIMQTELIQEQQELVTERNNRERMAGNITDQMYQEAQELLELFGVPYIIAPMEAEAQCAFLNDINLTDGTITDDSDIWLFGGQTVYKNFFNQKKHVLEFRAERIKHYFKLSREQMILLALLVGSDYTVGIQGIGPVTALEILASFPPAQKPDINILTQHELISGLAEFRSWLSDGRTVGPGRTTLRSKLQNVQIIEGFPSIQVVQAYLQPQVETCRDSFSWSKPDIVGLIDFAKDKFGWTRIKSEEILKPVIKKLGETNVQKSIRDYFATKHKLDVDLPESKMSKRVKNAVNRIAKKPEDINKDDAVKPKRRARQKINEKNTEPFNKTNTSKSKLEETPKPKTRRKTSELHAKETIPQRERDVKDALNSKLKAIEVFRKSKQGPGFIKRRQKNAQELKEAELSESSDSS